MSEYCHHCGTTISDDIETLCPTCKKATYEPAESCENDPTCGTGDGNRRPMSNPETSTQSGSPVDHHGLVVPRSPIPGWQWVKCDDCGTTWKETSRDILSPSHVDCPNHCDHGGDTHIWKTEQSDLPRDQSGNLLEYEREILTKGLGHNSQDRAREA